MATAEQLEARFPSRTTLIRDLIFNQRLSDEEAGERVAADFLRETLEKGNLRQEEEDFVNSSLDRGLPLLDVADQVVAVRKSERASVIEKARAENEKSSDFVNAGKKALFQIPALAKFGGSAVAELFGAEDTAATLRQEASVGLAETEREFPVRVQSLTDIEGVGDVARFVGNSLAEFAPDLLTSLTGAGLGAVLGKGIAKATLTKVARANLKEQLEKGILREVVKEASQRPFTAQQVAKLAADKIAKGGAIGRQAGGIAANLPITTGESVASQEVEGINAPGTALITGLLKAVVDLAPELKATEAIRKKFVFKLADELAEKLPKRKTLARSAITGGAGEGFGELLQNKIDDAAISLESGKDFELLTGNDLDAFVKGFIGGGTISAVSGAIGDTEAPLPVDTTLEVRKKSGEVSTVNEATGEETVTTPAPVPETPTSPLVSDETLSASIDISDSLGSITEADQAIDDAKQAINVIVGSTPETTKQEIDKALDTIGFIKDSKNVPAAVREKINSFLKENVDKGSLIQSESLLSIDKIQGAIEGRVNPTEAETAIQELAVQAAKDVRSGDVDKVSSALSALDTIRRSPLASKGIKKLAETAFARLSSATEKQLNLKRKPAFEKKELVIKGAPPIPVVSSKAKTNSDIDKVVSRIGELEKPNSKERAILKLTQKAQANIAKGNTDQAFSDLEQAKDLAKGSKTLSRLVGKALSSVPAPATKTKVKTAPTPETTPTPKPSKPSQPLFSSSQRTKAGKIKRRLKNLQKGNRAVSSALKLVDTIVSAPIESVKKALPTVLKNLEALSNDTSISEGIRKDITSLRDSIKRTETATRNKAQSRPKPSTQPRTKRVTTATPQSVAVETQIIVDNNSPDSTKEKGKRKAKKETPLPTTLPKGDLADVAENASAKAGRNETVVESVPDSPSETTIPEETPSEELKPDSPEEGSLDSILETTSKFRKDNEGARLSNVIIHEQTPSSIDSKGSKVDINPKSDGLFDPNTNTVHLFADKINSTARLERLLSHESFVHSFMSRFSPVEYKALISKIKSGDPVFKEWTERVRQLDKDGNSRNKLVNEKGDLTEVGAEEVLARYAEDTDMQSTLLGRLIRNVTRRLKKLFGIDISEDEVQANFQKAFVKYRKISPGLKITTTGEALMESIQADPRYQYKPSEVQDEAINNLFENASKSSFNELTKTVEDSPSSFISSLFSGITSPLAEGEITFLQRVTSLPEFLKDNIFIKKFVEIARQRQRDKTDAIDSSLALMRDYQELSLVERKAVDNVFILADKHDFDPSVDSDKTLTKDEEATLKAYNNLPNSKKRAFKGVRKTLDGIRDEIVFKMQGEIKELEGFSEGEILSSKEIKAKIDELNKSIEKLTALKAYFPRVRDEGHHVSFVRPSTGRLERVVFSGGLFGPSKKSEAQAKSFQKGLKDKGINSEVELVRRNPEDLFSNQLNQGSVNSLIRELQAGNADAFKGNEKALADGVRAIFAVRGFGKHVLSRQSTFDEAAVSGYKTEDLGDVLLSYVTGYHGSVTKSIAAAEYSKIFEGIDAKKQPNLFKFMTESVNDELRISGNLDRVIGTMQAAVFFNYLGFRASSAMVNLTQNYMVGVPNLIQDIKKAGKNINTASVIAKVSKAQKDSFKFQLAFTKFKDKGLSEEQMIRSIARGTKLTPSEVKGMLNIRKYIETESIIREGSVNMGGSSTVVAKGMRSLGKAGSFMFEAAESNNRLSAYLAHVRIFNNPTKADSFVDRTHFVYESYNQPLIFKGKTRFLKPILGGLATYQWNYWNWLLQNRKSPTFVMSVIGMALLFRGLPGEDILDSLLIRKIVKLGDIVRGGDGTAEFFEARKALVNIGGEGFADLIQKGLLPTIANEAGMGIDLSGSLQSGVHPVVALLAKPLGIDDPNAGPFQQMMGNITAAAMGETSIVNALPTLALQKLVKSWDEYQNGQTTQSGKLIVDPKTGEPIRFTLLQNLAMGLLGVNPLDRAKFKDKQYKAGKFKALLEETKRDIADRLLSVPQKDRSAIRKEIRSFNSMLRKLKRSYGKTFVRTADLNNSFIKSRKRALKAAL